MEWELLLNKEKVTDADLKKHISLLKKAYPDEKIKPIKEFKTILAEKEYQVFNLLNNDKNQIGFFEAFRNPEKKFYSNRVLVTAYHIMDPTMEIEYFFHKMIKKLHQEYPNFIISIEVRSDKKDDIVELLGEGFIPIPEKHSKKEDGRWYWFDKN